MERIVVDIVMAVITVVTCVTGALSDSVAEKLPEPTEVVCTGRLCELPEDCLDGCHVPVPTEPMTCAGGGFADFELTAHFCTPAPD